MIISISGKVSDMFCLQAQDSSDYIDYNGYVPSGMGFGGGDYIEIDIENETGRIVGWKPIPIDKLISLVKVDEE
jgi:hypothetical protein